MERGELAELHYIAHINNVQSILRHGILSHRRVSSICHTSIAMQEVQHLRAGVVVPGGRRLHEYVNLYFCARNPMLYKLQAQHLALCVLQVSTEVLDFPGVVVTDANASSGYVRFAEAPAGLSIVDRDLTFADDWRDSDLFQYYRKKSAKCTEVLVPDRVDPKFVIGAYVSCVKAMNTLENLRTGIRVDVNSHMFFLVGARP